MHKSTRSFGKIATASALAINLAAACGEQRNASGGGVTERDSAGVVIVEHTNDQINALPRWTIDTTAPLVHIAGTDSANSFSAIRLAMQRPGGRIVLIEAGEIREYSPAGKFERIIARRGRGPGEIEFVSSMQIIEGDSLVVFDPNQRRASVFARNGAFSRQVTFPRFADGSRFRANVMLADKRLLGTLRKSVGELTETDGPIRRDIFAIVRVATDVAANTDSAAPATVDTVVLVPDIESYPTASPSGGKSYPDLDFLIFGRKTNVAATDTRLVIGTNVADQIDDYNERGWVRSIRGNNIPEPVTQAQRERLHQDLRDMYKKTPLPPGEAAAILEYLLTKRRIATVHTFQENLTIGSDGTLWAETPRLSEQDARKFVVFDSVGRPIARAEFPERVVPHQFSRDRMLGVWLDDNDVPHVILWKIVPTQKEAR